MITKPRHFNSCQTGDEIVEVESAEAGSDWNSAPTNVQATVNGQEVTLTWDHVGADGYGVYNTMLRALILLAFWRGGDRPKTSEVF